MGATYQVSVVTTGVIGLNSRRRDTLWLRDWSSVVCSSDLSASNIPFTGQSYTYDTTVPTLSSVNVAGTSPTNTGPLTWTVTFSESVKIGRASCRETA